MKQIEGWWVPSDERTGFFDIKSEWKNKVDAVLEITKSKPRNICVQAGGHVGIMPIYLSNYFQKVYTFEPFEKNWECLQKNLEVVKDSNIVAYKIGLSDKNCFANLEGTIEGNSGATRLKEDLEGSMTLATLDSYGLEGLDLLWIDLEGFEKKALQGASESIKNFNPVIIAENNGLIHEFPANLDGSQRFREWMKEEFGYIHVARIMRDDFFIKET